MTSTDLNKVRGSWRIRRVIQRASEQFTERVQDNPDDIFDYEFDYLFILDACRYDIFDEVVRGEVESRVTKGSNSRQFIRKNFSRGDFSEFVYVSGNGFFDETQFREITGREEEPKDIFGCFFNTFREKWDDENNTVLPSGILEDVNLASKLFDKKIIAHFMQPHTPFIGSNNDVLNGEVWELLRKDELSRERAFRAYKQNLVFVLKEIKKVVSELDGKLMITADHGNMFGKMGFYAHPSRVKTKELRKVPMYEVNENIELRDEYADN